jgi:hypothetical protein
MDSVDCDASFPGVPLGALVREWRGRAHPCGNFWRGNVFWNSFSRNARRHASVSQLLRSSRRCKECARIRRHPLSNRNNGRNLAWNCRCRLCNGECPLAERRRRIWRRSSYQASLNRRLKHADWIRLRAVVLWQLPRYAPETHALVVRSAAAHETGNEFRSCMAGHRPISPNSSRSCHKILRWAKIGLATGRTFIDPRSIREG